MKAAVKGQVGITVRPEARLSHLIAILSDYRIGAIPVVDADARLVGIVSYLDVLHRLATGPRFEVVARTEEGAESRH